jgi:hypothetical protein
MIFSAGKARIRGARHSVVAALVAVLITASCSPEPEFSPRNVKPVEASIAGLSALFARECVDQRDLIWAKGEAARRADSCGGFLVGDGEAGDCRQSVSDHVYWTVPTSTHATVLIKMIWDDPTDRTATCSIAVSDALKTQLESVATSFASHHPLVRSSEKLPDEKLWFSPKGSERALAFFHRGQVPPEMRFDMLGQWAGRDSALERRHPHELEYGEHLYF